MIIDKNRGKLELNCKGPFFIEKVYPNGTYLLIIVEGDRIIMLNSACLVKESITLKQDMHLQEFRANKDHTFQVNQKNQIIGQIVNNTGPSAHCEDKMQTSIYAPGRTWILQIAIRSWIALR